MEQKTYSVYKVFLASSNELADDRKHFDDYVHKINHVLNGLGYHIEVVQWEFMDPAMPDDGRSQDEYNRQLKDCDECIVLFWHRLGKYTKEELDTAYKEKYSKGRLSRLTVYFKEAAPESITPELKRFRDEFPKNYDERYSSNYRSIESVESDLLLYFVQREGITTSARLTLNDSQILLNGKPVGDISKMSLTYGNKPYQKLLNEVTELEQGLQSAEGMVRYALATTLESKKRELQEMEERLFAIAQTIMRITIDDPDDEQVRRAKDFAAEGKFEEALALLGEDELIAEAQRLSTLAEAVKNKQRASVEKIVLRIQLLSAAKSDPTWVQQCVNLYRQAVDFARQCYAPSDLTSLIFSQAKFLQESNQFKAVEEAYREVLGFYRKQGDLPNVATTLYNMAILFAQQEQYPEAEKAAEESLTISRQMAQKSEAAYGTYVKEGQELLDEIRKAMSST
ncbi:MAG: tetratricopeptide repeat protein [Bacteroidales bacterium]|nr:tetratricopeptide repeat protein [Bacteroidales bacterium]